MENLSEETPFDKTTTENTWIADKELRKADWQWRLVVSKEQTAYKKHSPRQRTKKDGVSKHQP